MSLQICYQMRAALPGDPQFWIVSTSTKSLSLSRRTTASLPSQERQWSLPRTIM